MYEQTADRVADGVALSGVALYLANGETLAIIFSALMAGAYYGSKAVIAWLERRDKKRKDEQ